MKLLLLLVFVQAIGCAHSGEPFEAHDLWSKWTFAPAFVIPLAGTALLYLRGARRSRGVSRKQAACFWLGWVSLTLALVSPLHSLGEVLFSAHMVQHEVLMLVSAPLLALSKPLGPFLWSLPLAWRRGLGQAAKSPQWQRPWRAMTEPFTAWCIAAVALLGWHAPVLFQATLRSDWVHAAQHLSFFLSALLFWWALVYHSGRMGHGAAVLYLFTTAVYTSILGALLTFSPRLFYPAYATTTSAWGLTPLEDQQIGGLIMWIPAGLVYLFAGLAFFSYWLSESERMTTYAR